MHVRPRTIRRFAAMSLSAALALGALSGCSKGALHGAENAAQGIMAAQTPSSSGGARADSRVYRGVVKDLRQLDIPERVGGHSTLSWSEREAPDYVVRAGGAQDVADVPVGEIDYSELDSHGRTQRAVGSITYRLVAQSAGWRQDFEDGSDPSGWSRNARAKIELPGGRAYHGWFWNRSHLIADSLGGRAFRNNLVTGTRMQNVGDNSGNGGMAWCETRAVAWLKAHHDGALYYSAQPVYKGSELVPRSVVVDMRSSDGSIDGRYIVYNAAKGHAIDYSDGSWN